MKNWKRYLVLALIVGFAFVGLVIKNSLDISNAEPPHLANNVFSEATEQTHAAKFAQANTEIVLSNDDDNFESELIEKLKASYGDRIQELNIQASLIKVKEYVLERYPEDGNERFARIIQLAFPEYAKSIFSILERLEIYNEWVIDNQSMLLALSTPAQRGAVWEKRHELFGADAELIWADERAELSQKQSGMRALIQELDQANDISLDEKLYQLQTAVSENYEGSVQELTLNAGVMSQAFFSLESVQQELKQLPSEERQQKLNDVRRQLGLSEERIADLQTKDEARNKRWDKGLAYMAARSELIASTNEDEQAGALAELRQKYFKHEAITIQREEDSDFWRYKRRRVYGRN